MSWERIPGWTDEHLHALYERAVRDASSTHESLFVEVGVAFGRSAGLMATRIQESGKPIRFVGVDSWKVERWVEPELNEAIQRGGGFYDACLMLLHTELTADERARIALVRKDSVEAAEAFPELCLDFCFIDGAHDEASVARDLEAWLPKMRRERVIAGHDHTPGHPGVERAVRARLGAPGVGYEVLGSCWWHRTP